MKKYLAVMFAALVCAAAADAAPFRIPATVSNGVASVTIGTIYNKSATGVRVSSIWCNTAAANTNTAKIVIGGVTNTITPKAITANDHVIDVSAAPLLLSGDRVIVESTSTAVHLIYLVGEEL